MPGPIGALLDGNLAFGLEGSAPAPPPFVPDPGFAALMDRVVDIQVDRNLAGTVTTAHGYVPRGPWDPVGSAVPCHPVFDKPETLLIDDVPTPSQKAMFLFASPVALAKGHRLVLTDPYRQEEQRYFYVVGESQSPGGNMAGNGQPIYWRVFTEENTEENLTLVK